MIHRRTTDHRLEKILFRLLFLRLFLPTLVLILITMGSIGLVWQRTLSRQQIKLSRSIANTVATFTDSATRVLDALGQSLLKADSHHGSLFLETTQNAYSYFDTLYVIDAGGRLQQMMPVDPRYKNLDLSGQPYYRQARVKQEIFISAPFISMRSGKPTVYVARSIADERMVVGELNLGTLQVAIDTAIGGDREDVVFVADEAGSLLAHSNRRLVDEQFSLRKLPIVMQGLTAEIAQVYQSTDGLVFGAAVPLEDPRWVVVSQQSLESALKPLAGVAAPALCLSFLIWLWVLWALRRQFVKRVVAPVGRLATTAQRIAAGSLDEQAQADQNNEIGALATAFNSMTRRLRQRIEMENIVAGISRRLMEVNAEAIDREITLSLGEMGKFVSADRCYLFMLSENGHRMSNTHEWCSPSIQPFLDQLQDLPVADYPWLMQKTRSGEDILIDHVDSFTQASSSEKADWLRQGIQSLLCVPILTEGSLKGFVGFDAVSRQRDWSAQDATLLRLAGEIFYIAIERKQSEIALQEAEEKYRGIFEHATEGIFQSTVDGRFISANTSLARIYGYDTP